MVCGQLNPGSRKLINLCLVISGLLTVALTPNFKPFHTLKYLSNHTSFNWYYISIARGCTVMAHSSRVESAPLLESVQGKLLEFVFICLAIFYT